MDVRLGILLRVQNIYGGGLGMQTRGTYCVQKYKMSATLLLSTRKYSFDLDSKIWENYTYQTM